jgi:hypothetical protein
MKKLINSAETVVTEALEASPRRTLRCPWTWRTR